MNVGFTAWTAPPDERWRYDAACKDMTTDLFFAERGSDTKAQNEEAKAICKACPVRFQCLHDAMLEPQPWFGIRGGLTAKERRKLEWRPRQR